SQDFQTKMFEPFEQEEKTMEESESGTGLGLSIVKRLVELMGGSIACRSQENEGTEFVVILKAEIAVNALKNDGLGHEERGTECLAKKRVLLCEDHPLNMQIAVKLLSKKDMTVECAKNGAIAVEAFANSPIGYYDIILMDIRMPIMDGIEATKKIRSLKRSDSRRVPIIAMTANAFDEDVKKSLLAGLNYHLAKPIEPQKLYEAMAFQIEKAQGEGK
ncbi:MAG: response regulator, partial [Oscillospiraceae bacterium]